MLTTPVPSFFPSRSVPMSSTEDILDAVRSNNTKRLSALITSKANVHVKDSSWTPLHEAAFHGHSRAIQVLVAAKADVNVKGKYRWTPLDWAASNGHSGAVRVLVDAKASFDTEGDLNASALLSAAARGDIASIESLLEKKTEPDASDRVVQATALHLGAMCGHSDAVQMLVDAKASLDV